MSLNKGWNLKWSRVREIQRLLMTWPAPRKKPPGPVQSRGLMKE